MDAFANFIAPMTPEVFFSDYYGRRPVHIWANDDSRRALLSWARFNELLSIEGFWTAKRLKMVRDNVPIVPEHYSHVVRTPDGQRELVDPAKPPSSYDVPRTGGELIYYKGTGRGAQVVKRGEARVLRTPTGETALPTGLHGAVTCVMRRPAFAVQELRANFPQLSESEVQSVIDVAAKAGLIQPL